MIDRYLAMSRKQLFAALVAGQPVDPESLDDTEHKGISLGLPGWAVKLSWRTFRKTFHRDKATGALRGWNVRMEQHGIDGPRVAMMKRGVPFTFGHYVVRRPEEASHPKVPQGLLLDYDVPGNGFMRLVRDPLVRVEGGALLGWSYLSLWRMPTPSYFLLLPEGPLSFIPPS